MPHFRMNYTKPSKKRSIVADKRTLKNKIKAWELDKDFYDGSRLNGYGGFKYDGRWKKVLPKFIKRYKLKSGSKVLDLGCKKGFSSLVTSPAKVLLLLSVVYLLVKHQA